MTPDDPTTSSSSGDAPDAAETRRAMAETKSMLATLSRRENEAFRKLTAVANGLVPILRDHNLHNCAQPLVDVLQDIKSIETARIKLIQDAGTETVLGIFRESMNKLCDL